jgi:hypothetical protein
MEENEVPLVNNDNTPNQTFEIAPLSSKISDCVSGKADEPSRENEAVNLQVSFLLSRLTYFVDGWQTIF